MSRLDLTGAVEAAARGVLPDEWDDMDEHSQDALRQPLIPAIAAAAPLIEAQVRESIASELQVTYVRVTGPAHQVIRVTEFRPAPDLLPVPILECRCGKTKDAPTMSRHLGQYGVTATGVPFRREAP